MNSKVQRKYNEDKAKESFKKVDAKMDSDKKSWANDVMNRGKANLRNFKMKVDKIGAINLEEIENLCDYMHRLEDGFIYNDDIKKMKEGTYEPVKEDFKKLEEPKPS